MLVQSAAPLLLVGLLPALPLVLLLVGLLLVLLVGLLLVLLVGLLLVLLLQPARNAAVATPATASALYRLAIIPAGCRIPIPAASPAPGEGPADLSTTTGSIQPGAFGAKRARCIFPTH